VTHALLPVRCVRNVGAAGVSLAGTVLLQRLVALDHLGRAFALAMGLTTVAEAAGVLGFGALLGPAALGVRRASLGAATLGVALALGWRARCAVLFGRRARRATAAVAAAARGAPESPLGGGGERDGEAAQRLEPLLGSSNDSQ